MAKEKATKEKQPKAKLYTFTSDTKYLFIYPNIQFVDGQFSTDSEQVASHIRQYPALVKEVL